MRPTILLLTFMLLSAPAQAHNLLVRSTVDGEQKDVLVEVFFEDDTPAGQAQVRVENRLKKEIARGVTDDKGLWKFPVPKDGVYHIYADAGAGHRARSRLVIGQTDLVVPSREEQTAFPWQRLAIGLIALIVMTAACWWAARAFQKGTPPNPPL